MDKQMVFFFFNKSGIAYKFVCIYSTICMLSLFILFVLRVSQLILISQRFATELLFENFSHEVCQSELPSNCRFLQLYKLWQWSIISVLSTTRVEENRVGQRELPVNCRFLSVVIVFISRYKKNILYNILIEFNFFIHKCKLQCSQIRQNLCSN